MSVPCVSSLTRSQPGPASMQQRGLRPARMLEVKFLVESGVPSDAAHLLSNHYNHTRVAYYRNLDAASSSNCVGIACPHWLPAILPLQKAGPYRVGWCSLKT